MEKLIFNPKKDIKNLLDYGFKVVSSTWYGRRYELNLCENENGFDGLVIDEDNELQNYTNSDESTLIFFKLIKDNLIIKQKVRK